MKNTQNRLIQVYRHKKTSELVVVFRYISSKALAGKHTLQAMGFDYKGFLLKENSLNIYYTHVKPEQLTKEQQKQFNYILIGA